jgi:hypothetical protein
MIMMMIIMIVQSNSNKFFIYLSSELNSQWPVTESAQDNAGAKRKTQ